MLRELTGMSRADAEKAVNEVMGDEVPVAVGSASARVLSALDKGRTLDAIRLLREDSGMGLREAKRHVDAIMEQRGILRPKPDLGLIAVLVIIIALVSYLLIY